MKIKFVKRHNLIYPLMVIIFLFLRYADIFVINSFIKDGDYLAISTLYPLIMFLSEFISGLFFFIYFSKKNKTIKKTGLTKQILIYRPNTINYPDSVFKIYLLLFMGTYFDFNISSIEFYFFLKYEFSPILDLHARNILTLINSFLCYYLLRIKIYKHQILSLLIILICFIIVVVSEKCFQNIKETGKVKGKKNEYFAPLLIAIVNNFFNSFLDVIEKYLLEVDYMNPFEILMIEGIFGFFFSLIFIIFLNPFSKIIKPIKDIEVFILIICLFIYFITSAGRNIYRLITNKIYSPMVRTLTDSFLNPLFFIYYYYSSEKIHNMHDYKFLIINLIASIIIVFCGCVYNEFLILFCCDLEHETYHQISKRAIENDIEYYYELPSSNITE